MTMFMIKVLPRENGILLLTFTGAGVPLKMGNDLSHLQISLRFRVQNSAMVIRKRDAAASANIA